MINPMHTIAIRLTAFDDSVPEFKTVAERDAYHAHDRQTRVVWPAVRSVQRPGSSH